jgi:hypothetical protein
MKFETVARQRIILNITIDWNFSDILITEDFSIWFMRNPLGAYEAAYMACFFQLRYISYKYPFYFGLCASCMQRSGVNLMNTPSIPKCKAFED